MSEQYEVFLNGKIKNHKNQGIIINEDDLNPSLFDFQKFIVKVALEKGKFALFTDTGTGKTIMQLEWANHISKHTNKPVLILAPLAVSGQTIQEGIKFDIEVKRPKADQLDPGVYITNYEQIDNINPFNYSGIVLDESSILKNFTGKTRTRIIEAFTDTPFKLACTATPSPNDYMELGNHAEFLNVMSRNEMLAMFFVHDMKHTSKWRLKGHARKDFWQWVSYWAVMMMKPQDIGFSAEGYDLPELKIIDHKIETPKTDNGLLFNDISVNATSFNQELRNTKDNRIEKAAEIANNTTDNIIIWIKQNEEADALKKLIPEAVEVRGNEKPEIKEKKLLGFGKDEFRVLITKPKIAQFGLNYQNCHNQIFAAPDFSFEGLYQAIRRSYRFGQKEEVNIYIISTDTMTNVIKSLDRKQNEFEKMQQEMRKAGVNMGKTEEVTNVNKETVQGDGFKMVLGDSVQEIKNVESESIGLSVFSPPFADLYTYSNNHQDMGNSKDYNEFFKHFDFLTSELYRIIKPGRLVVIHCMDLPIQKGKEGYIGLRDFSGMIVKNYQEHGFIYHDRITIWKDPVVEMQRTKALGLLHKQIKKDSSMCRTGIPDYLLVFRREGDNPEPIKNTGIPVDLWQQYASPVWNDINYSNTLQRTSARAENDEKHIAPLQLETIARAIHLWSNPGDIVFSPFAGIGSEGYQALKMDRKFHGIELKQSYFEQAVKNLHNINMEKAQININELLPEAL